MYSVKTRRLCALNHWVNRRILIKVPCIEVYFNVVETRKAIIEYPILDMIRGADATAGNPESFKYEKWVERHESIITYLKGMFNIVRNFHVYYIIRPDEVPADPSEEDHIVFNE